MKNKKQGSFTRQLHLYQFKRLTDGRSRKHPKGYAEFCHENFLRDFPAKLDLMSRIPDKKGKGNKGKAAKISKASTLRKKRVTANDISLSKDVATPVVVGPQAPFPASYNDLVIMQVSSIPQPVAQPSAAFMMPIPSSANAEQAAVQNLPGKAFGFGNAELHNQIFQNSLQSMSFLEQVHPELYPNGKLTLLYTQYVSCCFSLSYTLFPLYNPLFIAAFNMAPLVFFLAAFNYCLSLADPKQRHLRCSKYRDLPIIDYYKCICKASRFLYTLFWSRLIFFHLCIH